MLNRGKYLLIGGAAVLASAALVMAALAAPTTIAPPSSTVAESARIDELVEGHLKWAGLPVAGASSDEVFLRRVYLDVIGVLPTAAEARAFLGDSDREKRRKLIDQLLERPEFADYWSLKWADLLRIKAEYPVNLWPKGAAAYYRWVRESLRANKPYDQFVREMLLATGSDFRDGPANFYRAVNKKDPQSHAESAALLFMGVRLNCARCHDAPNTKWTPQDNLGMAAFFGQVKFKATGEWKEEIVYVDPRQTFNNPSGHKPVTPKFLDGAEVKLETGQDGRAVFAAWLTTAENPWFSRNIVNRVWSWLLDRGLVEPPDDMRASNPPSNPKLLDYLAERLAAHHWDLKQTYRMILNSRTYQRSSEMAGATPAGDVNFARYLPRRLPAEVLVDAMSRVTETTQTYQSDIPEPYTRLVDWPAVKVADGSITSPMLELLGRPARNTSQELERTSDLTARQTMFLLNSNEVERMLREGGRLNRLKAEAHGGTVVLSRTIIEDLFLASFSRYPTAQERERLEGLMNARPPAQQLEAARDLMWAILNSPEFVFNH